MQIEIVMQSMKKVINKLKLKYNRFKSGFFFDVDQKTKENYLLGDEILISGWCFHGNKKRHNRIKKVILHVGDISVDGGFPHKRSDVQQHFSDFTHCAQSGFMANVRLNNSGQKTIRLELFIEDHESILVDTDKVLSVDNYRFNLDMPDLWNCLLTSKVPFIGWFFHETEPVKKLILHTGEKNSVCAYGIERKDVKKDFPDFSQAGNSGFYGMVSFESSGPKRIRFDAFLENGEVISHEVPDPLVVSSLIFNQEFPMKWETTVGERVSFSGWCYHEQKSIKNVILYVDDVAYDCTYRLYREDAKKEFPKYDGIKKSGFCVDLFFYSPGTRKIRYDIVFEDDEVFRVDPHKLFEIKPTISAIDNEHNGNIFSPCKSVSPEYLVKKSEPVGINLIGYFSSIFGNAETARTFVKKISRSGIPFSIFNVDSSLHQVLSDEELNDYIPYFCEKPVYDINLFFINADQLAGSAHKPFPYLFKDKYNIGVFWWEFDDYLDDFREAFHLIDHVIVFTDFIKRAVEKVAPRHVKITKLPYPFAKNWKITSSPSEVRKKYVLNKDDFIFFFSFDFLSTMERKNPEAVARAFSMAFSEKPDVKLVIKTNHSDRFSKQLYELLAAVDSENVADKVILVHDSLSRNDIMSLINAVDCYVSLHRSEGFGLGMAEAMYLGKPVIGTRHGGNLDFMNDDNSILLNYSMTSVMNDAPPYKKGWRWAEPDIPEASAAMMKVYEDREFARHLGKAAENSIKKQFNDKTFTNAVSNLLNSLQM